MAHKPEIQYVGQFYIHGSEARELARKEQEKHARTTLPFARVQQIEKVYVDPVALMGIAVAVIMLVVMLIGAWNIHQAGQENQAIASYLGELRKTNTELDHNYRSGFDLKDIEAKAIAMGMIPKAQANVVDVYVTIPVEEAEPTWWEDVCWFLDGLIE